MFQAISNLLYRRKDPTRNWRSNNLPAVIDVGRCTLCGVAVGAKIDGLTGLGPSEDCKLAARGVLHWRTKGLQCCIEDGRLEDFSVAVGPSQYYAIFGGRFLHHGQPLAISSETTPEAIVALLGEPFARSNNSWDDAVVLYYEYDCGEVQWAFEKARGKLDAIEVWYEPELAHPKACESYGIDKELPAQFRRKLFSGE